MVALNDFPLFRKFNTISLPAAVNEIAFKMKFSSVYGLPIALAGSDDVVSLGTTVILDGSESFDPSGETINFDWDLLTKPSGSSVSVVNVATPTVQFIPDKSGQYSFVLNVDNGTQSAVADTVIILASTKPVADAGPDLAVLPGKYVTLDGSGSHDADGDPITYIWQVVQKPEGSNPSLLKPAEPQALLRSTVLGVYKVTLVVNDGIQESDADTVAVTVSENVFATNEFADNISLYPNPATHTIKIGFGEESFKNSTIEIYNTVGCVLFVSKNNGESGQMADLQINLGDFNITTGVYIVRIVLDDSVFSRRLIVQ
jgi:hypothetical protein